MSSTDFDLVIRNGRTTGAEGTVDIGVLDGRIEVIQVTLDGAGEAEIDADGGYVSPSLVDCHVHMDKAFASEGAQTPRFNSDAFEYERIVGVGQDYFETTDPAIIEENAVRHGLCAVANGTRYLRTHVTVDPAWGTETIQAVARARDRLADVLDIEIVAYSEQGVLDGDTASLLEACLDAGADLVGGMDPGSLDGDLEAALDVWFETAAAYETGIDAHIHEAGTLGIHTIRRMAARTLDYDMGGDVTVSHGFSLAAADDAHLTTTLEEMRQASLNVVTCHQSIRPNMPVDAILDAQIEVGHGTDNIRDFVFAHGRADVVQGVIRSALKLSGEPSGRGYRGWETNDGVGLLWKLATSGGAEILGVDEYGIVEGHPANFVVFDKPSPEWVVLGEDPRRTVVADGEIVARDGTVAESVAVSADFDGRVL